MDEGTDRKVSTTISCGYDSLASYDRELILPVGTSIRVDRARTDPAWPAPRSFVVVAVVLELGSFLHEQPYDQIRIEVSEVHDLSL